jgi:hypothetical protein
VIFAIMEQTFDRLQRRFIVGGGSAIHSDGVYFWRCDTANYVETYRMALPTEFLRHGAACGWRPVQLDRAAVIDLHKRLWELARTQSS